MMGARYSSSPMPRVRRRNSSVAACTGLVTLESVLAAIPDVVPTAVEANQQAARDAFTRVQQRAARPAAAVEPVR